MELDNETLQNEKDKEKRILLVEINSLKELNDHLQK